MWTEREIGCYLSFSFTVFLSSCFFFLPPGKRYVVIIFFIHIFYISFCSFCSLLKSENCCLVFFWCYLSSFLSFSNHSGNRKEIMFLLKIFFLPFFLSFLANWNYLYFFTTFYFLPFFPYLLETKKFVILIYFYNFLSSFLYLLLSLHFLLFSTFLTQVMP